LSDNSLDSLDKALLEKLQQGFPLSPRPFQDLGQELGLAEKEALDRVRALKERGFIREIAAVLEPQALGFQTALVALKEGHHLGRSAFERQASIGHLHGPHDVSTGRGLTQDPNVEAVEYL